MLANPERNGNGTVQATPQGEGAPTVWGNTVVIHHADVQCSVLDGEAVLLNLETGAYFTLNRVGTVTWELLNGERTLAQVHAAICERFDVSEDVARQDLLALVTRLSQADLIQKEGG